MAEARFLARREARYGAGALSKPWDPRNGGDPLAGPANAVSSPSSSEGGQHGVASEHHRDHGDDEEEEDALKQLLRSALAPWSRRLEDLAMSASDVSGDGAADARLPAAGGVVEDGRRCASIRLSRLRDELDGLRGRGLAALLREPHSSILLGEEQGAEATNGGAADASLTTMTEDEGEDADRFLCRARDLCRRGEDDAGGACPSRLVELWHEEVERCSDRWTEVRNALLPRGKFVFARYRRQLEAERRRKEERQRLPECRDEAGQGAPSSALATSCAEARVELDPAPSSSSLSCLLENVARVHVVLDGRGVVDTSPLLAATPDDTGRLREPLLLSGMPSLPPPPLAASPGPSSNEDDGNASSVPPPSLPVRIRNASRCHVDLVGDGYPSVHLRGVSACAVRVPGGVPGGSVRAENCRDLHLVLGGPVQQIRLHDCSRVSVALLQRAPRAAAGAGPPPAVVTGGAILERCTAVSFTVVVEAEGSEADDDGDDPWCGDDTFGRLLEVKDFSFLKRGVPSPNFTVRRTVVRRSSSAGGPCPGSLSKSSGAQAPHPHGENEQVRPQRPADEEGHSFGGSVASSHVGEAKDVNDGDEDDNDEI